MTVITKPITEKKLDKFEQPLVTAECLPHQDAEAGAGDSLPPLDSRYLVLSGRASSVTTACVTLMALLIMCCGVLSGFYLYNQYAHSEMHRLRGWCLIPYDQAALSKDHIKPENYQKLESHFVESPKYSSHYLNEEFDIDGDDDSYEKITVPSFAGSRSSRFIHDFNANKTCIVDMDAHRCFVMPLNRTQVLPPRDLIDLVRKMWQGYYDVDTDMVRESMRVVLPPIKEPRSMGLYIQRECAGFPIYKLEKFVSGVFKRSAEEPVMFSHFSGKYLQLAIVNADELKQYEEEQGKVLTS